MRFVIVSAQGYMDRGTSKEDRADAVSFIMQHVRCRYTPQSKARAKAFAKQG